MAIDTSAQPTAPTAPKVPKFLEDVKEPYKFAFTSGGVDYWEFIDHFKVPYQRGAQAIVIYDEFASRTSHEYYKQETDAEDILLGQMEANLKGSQGQIDLIAAGKALLEMQKLIRNRRERMKLVVNPDLMYKLASVVYFDENESPYRYDMKYNLQVKIPRWKKEADMHTFFLQQPLNRLVPYLTASEINLTDYSTVVEKLLTYHQDHLTRILSRKI